MSSYSGKSSGSEYSSSDDFSSSSLSSSLSSDGRRDESKKKKSRLSFGEKRRLKREEKKAREEREERESTASHLPFGMLGYLRNANGNPKSLEEQIKLVRKERHELEDYEKFLRRELDQRSKKK